MTRGHHASVHSRSHTFAHSRLFAKAVLTGCVPMNGLEPYAYLRRVLTELPKAQSLADIEALLPTRLDPADLS